MTSPQVFAIASGMTPESGIYTAIIAGFLISLLGGCKVQIGGPAGAFIVIVYGIIAQYGVGNLLIATFFSGIFLFLMGLFKIGSFIRFIPVSIVIGFTNGIAVLIGLSQIKDFLGRLCLASFLDHRRRTVEKVACQNSEYRRRADRHDGIGLFV